MAASLCLVHTKSKSLSGDIKVRDSRQQIAVWTLVHSRMAGQANAALPSDLTDALWSIIEPMLPPSGSGGHPVVVEQCEIINAILYLNCTGCQWRMCAPRFPQLENRSLAPHTQRARWRLAGHSRPVRPAHPRGRRAGSCSGSEQAKVGFVTRSHRMACHRLPGKPRWCNVRFRANENDDCCYSFLPDDHFLSETPAMCYSAAGPGLVRSWVRSAYGETQLGLSAYHAKIRVVSGVCDTQCAESPKSSIGSGVLRRSGFLTCWKTSIRVLLG